MCVGDTQNGWMLTEAWAKFMEGQVTDTRKHQTQTRFIFATEDQYFFYFFFSVAIHK